jgi:hypothetical protein
MPREIKDGFTVNKGKERIIELGAELSALPNQYKIKLEKREGDAGFTHYLTIVQNGTKKEYVCHEKIPPDTGLRIAKANGKKAAKKKSGKAK